MPTISKVSPTLTGFREVMYPPELLCKCLLLDIIIFTAEAHATPLHCVFKPYNWRYDPNMQALVYPNQTNTPHLACVWQNVDNVFTVIANPSAYGLAWSERWG